MPLINGARSSINLVSIFDVRLMIPHRDQVRGGTVMHGWTKGKYDEELSKTVDSSVNRASIAI